MIGLYLSLTFVAVYWLATHAYYKGKSDGRKEVIDSLTKR